MEKGNPFSEFKLGNLLDKLAYKESKEKRFHKQVRATPLNLLDVFF